jgi:hypothetical protein
MELCWYMWWFTLLVPIDRRGVYTSYQGWQKHPVAPSSRPFQVQFNNVLLEGLIYGVRSRAHIISTVLYSTVAI